MAPDGKKYGNSRSKSSSKSNSRCNSRGSSQPNTRPASPQHHRNQGSPQRVLPPWNPGGNPNRSPPRSRPLSPEQCHDKSKCRGWIALPRTEQSLGYDPIFREKNVEYASNWEARDQSRSAHHREMHGGGPGVPGWPHCSPSSSGRPRRQECGWTDGSAEQAEREEAARCSQPCSRPVRAIFHATNPFFSFF